MDGFLASVRSKLIRWQSQLLSSHALGPYCSHYRGGDIRRVNGVARRDFLKGAVALGAISAGRVQAVGQAAEPGDRAYWVEVVRRVSEPVLEALSKGQLRTRMPVEAAPGLVEASSKSTHLEAFGRLLSGLGPWLESTPADGAEAALQARYREWARGRGFTMGLIRRRRII